VDLMDVTSEHVRLPIQYTLMAACCCLGRDPVSADHRRRKKLHGVGCKIAEAVLREVSPVPLEAFSINRSCAFI